MLLRMFPRMILTFSNVGCSFIILEISGMSIFFTSSENYISLFFCPGGIFFIHIFLGAFWGGLDVPDGTSDLPRRDLARDTGWVLKSAWVIKSRNEIIKLIDSSNISPYGRSVASIVKLLSSNLFRNLTAHLRASQMSLQGSSRCAPLTICNNHCSLSFRK